jgi:hypothetical protein
MNVSIELSNRAVDCGIFIAKDMTVTRLIRRIQRCDGHTPCFRTDSRVSCQETCDTCEWADDCKNALVARWKQ